MLRRRPEPPRFTITSDSLDALFRSHAPGMAVYIARKTMDAGVAADLTAETFAQAFTNRRQFRGRTREEAVGQVVHRLLATVFPEPVDDCPTTSRPARIVGITAV